MTTFIKQHSNEIIAVTAIVGAVGILAVIIVFAVMNGVS